MKCSRPRDITYTQLQLVKAYGKRAKTGYAHSNGNLRATLTVEKDGPELKWAGHIEAPRVARGPGKPKFGECGRRNQVDKTKETG